MAVWTAQTIAAADVSFIQDVAPILTQRCTGCHGPTKVEGDYRLHTFEYLLNAGASESKPIVAGKPADSELLRRLIDADESTRMPQQDDPLSATEIDVIKRWIAEGAKFGGTDLKASIKSQLPPRVHPDPPQVYRVPVPIYVVAFSPDGQELAVGGHHEVTIWNPADGSLRRRLKKLPQRIQSLVYNRDGSRLLIGGGSPGDYGELSIIDPRGESRPQVLATFDDIVLAVALSRDNSRAVATSADRSVRCFTLPDGKPAWRSQLHSDFVTSVGFSHDDRFVATGSKDFTVKVLESATGNLFTTYNGHQRQYGEEKGRFEIFSLAFSNDQPLAFSAGEGRSIRVWEPVKAQAENGSAADMEERFSKAGHTKYLFHEAKHSVFKLSVFGNHLFAATGDGLIKQYDVSTLQHVRDFTGHRDWVFAADYHPGSARLATGSFDGEVRIWETSTGQASLTFLAAPGLRPLHSAPPQEAETKPAELPQPTSRKARDIEGWTIRVDDRLLEETNAVIGTKALKFLEAKLVEIKAVVPAERVKPLQAVTIVLDLNCGKLGAMQYHPSAGWLKANGYPMDLAKCVHLPRAADLPTRRNINEQPWVILHELAHAYHDQVLDFDEPRIMAAYEKFKSSGRGDATLLYNGKRVKHYALTNQKEFFAEMTESFFGVNDFFPFNRAELQEAEPELFELLTRIWISEKPASR